MRTIRNIKYGAEFTFIGLNIWFLIGHHWEALAGMWLGVILAALVREAVQAETERANRINNARKGERHRSQ